MPMRERVHIKYPYICVVAIVIRVKKARSLVFLGLSDGEKSCFVLNGGVLNYALECRLDGVQNHSRSRPYLCTRALVMGSVDPLPFA